VRDLSGKGNERDRRRRILTQLSRLESVERRWLGSVLSSLIFAAFITSLLVNHLEIGHLVAYQPATIPALQFILIIVAAVIILVMNLSAFIDYFAFEVHVERQVVIRKKRTRTSDEGSDVEEEQ
jgi:predicted Co/Zn/Cd cation transporter (cation efflux family)